MRNFNYNSFNEDIATLQGKSDSNYAIELNFEDNGEIVGWQPYVYPNEFESSWWAMISKNEQHTKEYESLLEDSPLGLWWCAKYFYARMEEHVYFRAGTVGSFRRKFSNFLAQNPEIGNKTDAMMAMVSADFAPMLR